MSTEKSTSEKEGERRNAGKRNENGQRKRIGRVKNEIAKKFQIYKLMMF